MNICMHTHLLLIMFSQLTAMNIVLPQTTNSCISNCLSLKTCTWQPHKCLQCNINHLINYSSLIHYVKVLVTYNTKLQYGNGNIYTEFYCYKYLVPWCFNSFEKKPLQSTVIETFYSLSNLCYCCVMLHEKRNHLKTRTRRGKL